MSNDTTFALPMNFYLPEEPYLFKLKANKSSCCKVRNIFGEGWGTIYNC